MADNNPQASLVEGDPGIFYGMTVNGGSSPFGDGTIFRITAAGDYTTLHSFNASIDGKHPLAALVNGYDGYLYGTTPAGGYDNQGIVFRLSPNGDVTVIHSFSSADGGSPNGGLMLSKDGSFIGTTSGDSFLIESTIYRIRANGDLTTLYQFSRAIGPPAASLVQGLDGTLYGIGVPVLGLGNGERAFQIKTNGSFKTIHLFNPSHATRAFLSFGGDGLCYGTRQSGGTNIAGATTSTLSLSNLLATQAGAYSFVASNEAGSVTSAPARLSYLGLSLSSVSTNFTRTLTLGDVPGSKYRIDATVNLSNTNNWLPLTNLTLTTSPLLLIDPSTSSPSSRFYRAVPLQ